MSHRHWCLRLYPPFLSPAEEATESSQDELVFKFEISGEINPHAHAGARRVDTGLPWFTVRREAEVALRLASRQHLHVDSNVAAEIYPWQLSLKVL